MSSVVTPPLMTAEEFVARHDKERVELVRGVVEALPMPWPTHGKVCMEFGFRLRVHADARGGAHVISNDSWMRTGREPDTVRGPDLQFYWYSRLPRGKLAPGFIDLPPDLVVEVRSPSDRASKLNAKALEYLASGVRVVVVVDPQKEAVIVFRDEEFAQTFHNGDPVTIPDVLPGFSLSLDVLFERTPE